MSLTFKVWVCYSNQRLSFKVPETVWIPDHHHKRLMGAVSYTYLRFSSDSGSSWPGPPWHRWWTPTLADLKHCGHWELHHLVVRGQNYKIGLSISSLTTTLHFLIWVAMALLKSAFVAFLSIWEIPDVTAAMFDVNYNYKQISRIKSAYSFLWTFWRWRDS